MTGPAYPAAGATWTPRPSGLMSMTASPPVGSTAVTMRTSPFGSVSLARTSTSIGRSTRVCVSSSRAIGGRFGPSSSISSDCTISAFGSSGLTSVMTSPPSSSVLSSSLSSLRSGQDVAPVLDAVEALLRAGDPGRAGVDVVDPDPAVDEAQAQLRAGAVERRRSGPRPSRRRRSRHHWANVGRRRRHGEDAPAVDDRRRRRRARELADLGVLSPPASGRATRRPSGVAATTWSAAGAGLLEDQRRPVAVGVGDLGRRAARRRRAWPRTRRRRDRPARPCRRRANVIDTTAVGEVRAPGSSSVEPSGSQEHDLVGGLVGEHGVAVGRGRRQRRRPRR